MSNEISRTNIAQVWMTDNGIFHAIFDTNVNLTLEEAKEIIALEKKLSGGNRHPAFVDIQKVKTVHQDARQYFASDSAAEIQVAAALLIGSPVSRAIGNFFLRLNKPILPVQMFTDKKQALHWLEQFL